MVLLQVTIYITLAIAFFGGVFGFIYLKRLRSSFKWLSAFLLFSALAQGFGQFLGQWYGTNLLYYNVILPVYYLLIYLIFANFSKDKRTLAINNILFAIGAIFLFIFLAIDINNGSKSDKAITICNLFYSLAAFILIFDMLRAPLKKSPLAMPEFYFLFGFLFYHSSIIFFWAADAIFKNESNKFSIAYVNITMLFIYYCTLTATLVVESKNNRVNGS